VRSRNRQYLGVLQEVAAWREREAQRRDLPRGHVLKDEGIQELAAERPHEPEGLKRLRAVPKGLAEGRTGAELLEAIDRGQNLPKDAIAVPPPQAMPPRGLGPTVDLLKVLLKLKSEEHAVAAKLIATVADLEQVALSDAADVPALKGWRAQIFGSDALALKNGRLALAARRGRIELIPLDGKGGRG
jgi:ribonuclease D